MTERLKLGVDLDYGKNPDFDKEFSSFFKVIYKFEVEHGERKGA